MDYKETLLLPTTNFAMRGNLINNEPERYASWDKNKIYEKMKANRKGAPSFTLHDGPPYANGNIHIGHALNKVLKDIIIKRNYFDGKSVRFTPGWDCHGLPIEQQVEKKLGGKQKKELLEVSKVRELCRAHAAKFVDIQKSEFKQLGILADWENPYVTMDYKFEANIYRTLCGVAKKGLLIERSKPVYWSWAERTALAEAEVEYEDKESHSIYVAFELSDEAKAKADLVGKASLVIWTTTPWTLPSNTGISLHPEEKYVLTTDGYIVAKALFESLLALGVVKGEIAKEVDSKSLEGQVATNPLNGRTSKIVLGDHVLMDSGTGGVHTAPGHGEDDYRVGLKYDLEVIMPVDETGCFDETVVREKLLPNPEEFVGQLIFKTNDRILELLGDSLLYQSKFTHSYPHCWRSHTPLIFRATRQWFISVDEKPEGEDKTLRNIALSEVEKTLFFPKSGKNRLNSMVANRPDWCISRQRDWGVPIAFFRVKETGEVLFDEKVLNFTAMIFEMQGSDAWYSMPIEQLLYPGSGYKADELEKVTDILDVWFDSGSTWNSVLKSRNYDAGEYQADLYVEGSDQHRGWFQSSLFLSCAVEHKAPYKAVLTHGFTVDEKGEKMSKSKGNVIAPEKVLKEYGSEILRLWVASSDYQGDLKISDGILKQTSENYRKLRNTFRIMLANINDLETISAYENMGELDKWILNVAKNVFKEVHKSFTEYNYVNGMSLLNNFIVNELSGMYIDMTKDSLYCNAKTDPRRMASQSAMAIITKSLLLLMAPILTYTADEIVENAPAIIKGDAESIFDMTYAEIQAGESTFDALYMTKAREGFGTIVDALKKEKIIKSTLEVVISTDSNIALAIDSTDAEDWFVVSCVSDEASGDVLGTFKVEDDIFTISKATAHKCPRCWKYQAASEDTTCKRCEEVVSA
ncbi:isoleucyl-tRNA synthetase [Sulfurimonas gotlandica GD1]|uniref:Isoleucine--tRNA ligase n=1 Tax=Sulfurimonas gotlandica (strain DSM 19862 / JCM 16533 / GD1) TaxID=929558 RepID=B6BNN2_SULGG|nr:isoleucine--tRNA ligase [Sulfurimonas gotlandica]EDZ61222.1 isoleucyl-tRNA synthetase [Sulfurimonas gotlandica GD1]EHP28835.1 isoleucyl-tRNA synthetase [Sulfurimonas gotlandica GD1]